MTDDWRRVNLANWESRVPVHTGPDGYEVAGFDDPGHFREGDDGKGNHVGLQRYSGSSTARQLPVYLTAGHT